MKMRITAPCMVLLCGAVFGAAPAFDVPPTARMAGDEVTVTFALKKATDVEVAILNAAGKVVRHLAAGVPGGKNPPPAPLKPGLSQTLSWDGMDDFGKPAAGGPFRARVRAGMSVKFGRILGGSPYTGVVTSGAPFDSLATAADGTLYVKMASLVGGLHQFLPWQVRKFDKSGKYIQTVLPYAASTDPAKTTGWRLIDAGDGLLTPAATNPLDPSFCTFGDNVHNQIVNGSLVFIDNRSATLRFFKLDGSNAVKVVPMRTSREKLKWPKWLAPQVAFSPDGKYAYYSNVANTPYDGKKPGDIDPKFPQGRVYRHDLTRPGADPKKFYDLELPDWEQTKYWMPSAWDKKTAAAGVAVDAKGNLFVCDLVNQQVVEVSPAGKKLSATKVPWPDKVMVSSRTGTLYVVSRRISRGYAKPATLLKVTGRGAEAKVAARLRLKGTLGQCVALDDSGETTALWLGGGGQVVRVEDRGDEFEAAGEGLINRDKNAIAFLCYGDVDTEAELVYVTEGMGRVWRYNGETGEGGLAPIKASDLAIGRGGMIYAWGNTGSYQGPVTRYTRDFKPAPLAATGKHTYGSVFGRYGRGNSVAGMDVDHRGWVYAVCGFNDCHLRVYDAEGKLVDYDRKAAVGKLGRNKTEIPAFLSHVLDQGGSVRVDTAGNVYVLEIGLPKGFTPPAGFERDPAYRRCTGTIYKFTPKGGTFRKGPAGYEAVGAVQRYAGCGPISGSWASTMSVCHCTRPRFDVDGYGRLYIPNAFTFKVSVRDNADNEILSFGGYGNFDSQGPDSKEPTPAIPLGWPIFAGASDKYIYVGDCLNHRVVRVDRTYAAEATCDLK